MEEKRKIGLLEQFQIACTSPKRFKELLNVGKGQLIIFFLIITFLTTLLGFGLNVVGLSVSVGGPKNFIMNRLPKFELKNGTLDVEDPVDFTIMGVHIVADTSKKKVDEDTLDDQYPSEIIFAKEGMLVKADSFAKMRTPVSFADHKEMVFNNQSLYRMMPWFYIFMIMLFFGMWIQQGALYLLISLLITLFVRMNARTQGSNIVFKDGFKLAIYARVIFEIIETAGMAAGLTFFTGFIWTIISYGGSYFLVAYGLGAVAMPKINKE